MRKVLVKEGIITNIIVVEESTKWTPPTGIDVIDLPNADIGDYWDGKILTKKIPQPEPADELALLKQQFAELKAKVDKTAADIGELKKAKK